MASKADIEAGKAFVTLYVKGGPLDRGLKSAGRTIQTWGRGIAAAGAGITGLGAAIAAPLVAATKHFIDSGDEIEKFSKRTGLAAQNLAELRYAAGQSDLTMEQLAAAMRYMVTAGFDPARFDEIAESIAAIEDPTQRAARAMEIFGTRNGTALLPMILSLKDLRAEARANGVFISDDEADRAAKLGDAFNRMRETVAAVVFRIGAALEPMITSVLDVVQKVAIGIGNWVSKNAKAAQWFAVIASALLVIGPIVTAIGAALVGIGAALGGLPVLLGAIKMISLPVLAIAVAIAAAIASMVYWTRWWIKNTELGRRAWEFVLDTVGKVLADVKQMGEVLVDVFSSGDIEAAFDAVTAAMRVSWHELMADILGGIAVIEQFFLALQGNPMGGYNFNRWVTEQGKLLQARQDLTNAVIRLEMAKQRQGSGSVSDPSQPGYGLPERSASVIGSNFRAAQLGRQIIGSNPVLVEMKRQADLLKEQRDLLREINRKTKPIIAG